MVPICWKLRVLIWSGDSTLNCEALNCVNERTDSPRKPSALRLAKCSLVRAANCADVNELTCTLVSVLACCVVRLRMSAVSMATICAALKARIWLVVNLLICAVFKAAIWPEVRLLSEPTANAEICDVVSPSI